MAALKDIPIKFIPQSEQRYAAIGQVGDYWETDTTIEFRITQFDNPAYSHAILMHELHEKFRNNQLGILDADVDQFDLDHPDEDDPGMNPSAPYHRTHLEAVAIERMAILLCGEDWADYDSETNKISMLYFNKPKSSITQTSPTSGGKK